ncbi:hypothetical protein [Aridibaculum aurantiacum]|uniref:hypothetical protein n=1 Tax=Aridibaculum aurantiacum TaxID=2810307 RepID=UPI001A9616DC|nr:hypothetical protein [Aridibaculum aurantiacum]
MDINQQQLEMNVNLHSLRPEFLNRELHYIIASDENNFRFVSWDQEPSGSEMKFYCFLVEKELHIPAGNVTLKESYILDTKPMYPLISNAEDFIVTIKSMDKGATKCVRKFADDDIDNIQKELQAAYGNVEQHMVKSPEFQHLLLVLDNVEISISATMVYFKQKVQFTEQHYQHIKEEAQQQ